MVTASSQLVAFLASGAPFYGADLFTFSLTDGTTFRVTSFGADILYGGNTYSSLGPYIDRSKIKLSTKLEVSTCIVTIKANPNMLIESTAVLLLIAQGRFNG